MEAPDPDEMHDVLSTLLHDLNNPLSIIDGNAQFLLEVARDEEQDGPVQEALRDIHDATGQLSRRLKRLEELRDRFAQEDSA
ncbi:MAG: histidine kinase dimerization/phospho-acceptor domain-containing protein [Longimonas sp.]|uniref:histidine kinase dimerization/phospho-acceptor domain-containing protein n=1 Tax=Longimonas sp. TaxID=2039626 RepID=UPI0033578A86